MTSATNETRKPVSLDQRVGPSTDIYSKRRGTLPSHQDLPVGGTLAPCLD